ncbi:MAG: GNAT family N-acetyltransferase [Candidatus Glassbacteria bacterium]
MNSKGVTYRRYQSGDEADIVRLFKEVYGHKRSIEHWKWKFKDNVMRKTLIWLAEDERGHLVAHYAICPVPVQLGETVVMGAQSLDTMVAKDYQRRRLMVTLARKCYDDARDAGIDIIYGYPNEKSYSPLVHRLGFSDLGNVKRYELTFSTLSHFPTTSALRRIGFIGRVINKLDQIIYPDHTTPLLPSTQRIQSYSSHYESLWERARRGRFGVCRNQGYLNWRYGRFPDYGYLALASLGEGEELEGFIIIGLKNDAGCIAELMPIGKNVTKVLILAAIRELKKMGIGKLFGYFLIRQDEREALKDVGFVERSSGLVFCVKFLGNTPPENLYSREAWYMSFGDTDGI